MIGDFSVGVDNTPLSGRERWSPHVACPECANIEVQRTGIFDGETEVVLARCPCGWKGTVDELIEGESD